MDNKEIIKRVNLWQNDGIVHKITCYNSSSHKPLYPVEEKGEVILKCHDCDYVQNWIPKNVLKYTEEMSNTIKEQLGIKNI